MIKPTEYVNAINDGLKASGVELQDTVYELDKVIDDAHFFYRVGDWTQIMVYVVQNAEGRVTEYVDVMDMDAPTTNHEKRVTRKTVDSMIKHIVKQEIDSLV